MGIDLQALSITSAFNSILSFFKSQENNSRWKDLSTGAEGIFLIRMLANILSNISYRMITARRENFLSTANLLSSCLGVSVNLGYSANRGSNQKRLITLIPNKDYVIKKLDAIGAFNEDVLIYALDDLTLKAGVSTNINVVIGRKNVINFRANTNRVQPFTRFETGISQDFVLRLYGSEPGTTTEEGTVVPTTENMKELLDDMYLVRTNPYSSVDILYLNNVSTNKYRYGSESWFSLEYIILEDLQLGNLSNSMFSCGDYVSTLYTQNYVPFETPNSLKINAPIDHEVQNLIRSKDDYAKRVKQVIPNVIQASYTPVTPTYTLISYLKDDYTLLQPEEISTLNKVLLKENFFGTPLPDLTSPIKETIDLNITIATADKLKESREIREDIDNIIKSSYSTLMNQTFNTYSLERLIEGLSYVKWARVKHKDDAWQPRTTLPLGTVTKENDLYYKASRILGLSNATEPLWNIPQEDSVSIDTGLITYDGSLTWKTYKRLNVSDITAWSAGAKHKIGDYVYASNDLYADYMFKCIDIKKMSGNSIIDTTTIDVGDFITDGGIIWVCINNLPDLPERQRQTSYTLGDSVNIGGKTFQVISYAGRTSDAKPMFEVKSLPITQVDTDNNKFMFEGNKSSYFNKGDIIKAPIDEENKGEYSKTVVYTFKVKSVTFSQIGNTVYTNIETEQDIPINVQFEYIYPDLKGTQDGELLWEIVDDVDDITYNWNVYNSFQYDLNVV